MTQPRTARAIPPVSTGESESKPTSEVNVNQSIKRGHKSPTKQYVLRIAGLVAAGVVVYGLLFVWQGRQAYADTGDTAVAEEVSSEPVEEPLEDAEATSGSRLSQAFDFLVKGDSSAIVKAASDELEARQQAADEREAVILTREAELSEAEAATAAALEKAQSEMETMLRERSALQDCVLGAIRQEKKE